MGQGGRDQLSELRRAARETFDAALSEVDAGLAVSRAVEAGGTRLRIGGSEFDLSRQVSKVYSVALGKAARPMASALDRVLGERLVRGVASCATGGAGLPRRWEVFAGGHPLPNEASVEAARAALTLLAEANREDALVVFLVSGGGSAMLELPRVEGVTLEDLREANRVLVSCGASIAEVNSVRRALSAVKGGGLCGRAPRAPQVTLVVSDVNAGSERDVASGPTYPAPQDAPEAARVVERYKLAPLLPPPVLSALERPGAHADEEFPARAPRLHHVILDNRRAVEGAVRAALSRGFVTEIADDLVEQHVAEGSAALVARLRELYRREAGLPVCLVSGGEFACPVRGAGVGGRNAETALRCALEFERLAGDSRRGAAPRHSVALSAGTDGVDGNSPAAGAVSDSTTLARARAVGLDARAFLDRSDAYTFFDALGDTVVTGPTGTNVRDLRILLAK